MERGQVRCAVCGATVPTEQPGTDQALRPPCLNCGSTSRAVTFVAKENLAMSDDYSRRLIISWHEVDRLLDKAEYGAALLVAAINVQFIRSVAQAPAEARHDEKPAASEALVREITDVRNKIAHERGYFALLTQLRDPSWPEARIRQVLKTAKEFCHGNAP
jgi:hypothetical protein